MYIYVRMNLFEANNSNKQERKYNGSFYIKAKSLSWAKHRFVIKQVRSESNKNRLLFVSQRL